MTESTLMWLFLSFLIGYIGGSIITAMVVFRRSTMECSEGNLERVVFEVEQVHAYQESEPVPFAPLHPGLPDTPRHLRWSSFPCSQANRSISANSSRWLEVPLET